MTCGIENRREGHELARGKGFGAVAQVEAGMGLQIRDLLHRKGEVVTQDSLELLASFAESHSRERSQTGLDLGGKGGWRVGSDADHAGIYVGRGPKSGAADVEKAIDRGDGLDSYSQCAIGPVAGRSEYSIGDLALYHQDDLAWPDGAFQQMEDNWGCNVVGYVADDLQGSWLGGYCLELHVENILVDDGDGFVVREARGQLRGEKVIQLNENQLADAAGEVIGQRPPARPDLEDDILGRRSNGSDDLALKVGVDEEVLTEGFLRAVWPARRQIG